MSLSKERMINNKLFAYYNSEYHTRRNKDLLDNDKYFWARARTSNELYFSEFTGDSKVLEFGVGIGQNIVFLKNAYGYDISKEALDACRKRQIPVFESLESIPNNEFDIVLSRHSLEHVPDPLESLTQMKAKLKNEGTLILVLPKDNHGKASFEPDLNNHLFCWNFRSINNLLNVAGFKPVKNELKYTIGFNVLLPLYNIFGYRFYLNMVKITGRLSHQNGELIVHAKKND